MKNILILGAGQSTPYLIKYLLDNALENDWFITVCDRDYESALKRINGHARGVAIEFSVNDATLRKTIIKGCDVVVNMLAPQFQYLIALDCIHFKKHCITASYEDVKVQDLNQDAIRSGVLILNEMGLDPGIDHILAMSIIQDIRSKGGNVTSLKSYGSGLPAPEVKANPLDYCITWNPRNIVMAGEYGAQFMQHGKIKVLSLPQIFQRTWSVNVKGVGELEAYPNRDSLVYQKTFNLPKIRTMIRATLRYPGWSETWLQIVRLGMANETMRMPNLKNKSYAEFTEMFLPTDTIGVGIESRTASYLGINPTGHILHNLIWLGLFSEEKIGTKLSTAAEVLTDLLKKRMVLPQGARDMVILLHEIEAVYPKQDHKREKTTVSFIEYGDPDGYTAISKTVGLPAALAVKLLLTNRIQLTGCYLPTHPAIYSIVLDELINEGMKFEKTVEEIH